jgi:hypothetical protein
MKRKSPLPLRAVLTLVAFSACAFAQPVSAQAAEKRIALVIGNGAYRFSATLKNPPHDAADMASVLKRDDFQVTVLTNAGRDMMEKSLRAFGISLKDPDAVGLFYYSGHGAQADGQNYMLPVDADIQDVDELRYKAMDVEAILAKMRSAGNKLNIVILDACRNNPFPGSSRAGEKGLAIVKVKVPDSVIVFATDPGSTAEDGDGRNSPFTEAFMAVMEKPGIDIAVMMKQVTGRVQAATGGKQTPWVSTNLTKDFAFAAVNATATAAQSTTAPIPRAPTLKVTPKYGSLIVTAATAGSLYLDGLAVGDIPEGADARLDDVAVGDRLLELRYPGGRSEQHTVTVEPETTATVKFAYKKVVTSAQKPISDPTADLFKLVKNGTLGEVLGAIARGANVNAVADLGVTPLSIAAEYNTDPGVIGALVKAGANVNAPDSALLTPLMHAAFMNKNPLVLTALIQSGADPMAADSNGKTAIDFAQQNRNLKGSYALEMLTLASGRSNAVANGTSELPAVGGKDSLKDGDTLPNANIKIDGKFDDWSGIRPAFTSGNRTPESESLAIDKVYLAVDAENLYMRFDIKDVTPSSFFHPNNFDAGHRTSYAVDLRGLTGRVIARLFYDDGRWRVQLGKTDSGQWEYIFRDAGYYSMKGPTFEASFPLEAIKNRLDPIASSGCSMTAFTGYDNAQGDWVDGDHAGPHRYAF